MVKQSARSDAEIQRDVQQELRWDSVVDESTIGVTVDRGVVTLNGTVGSLAARTAAQDAAHRVRDVLDVANDIRVGTDSRVGRSDSEVAHAVRSALEWNALLDDELIRSTVTHGWVLLEGTVTSCRERDEAESAVRNLIGVCGVNNEIVVQPLPISEGQVRQAIEAALERRAKVGQQRIDLSIDNGVVVMSGTVGSLPERAAAVSAAKGTLGVRAVVDHLRVSPG